MRRAMVLESDPEARAVILDVLASRACQAVFYAHADQAQTAWNASFIESSAGYRGNAYHVAILDGRPHDDGFDLARFVRGTSPACTVIVTVDNPAVAYQSCDDIRAACVHRATLRRGLLRELGFEGTLPAGLTGRTR